jgi:hypothetical protein
LDVPAGIFLYTTVSLRDHSVDRIGEVTIPVVNDKKSTVEEDSSARMQRLAEEMRFRIKESMVQRGGSEAFLSWLRTDDAKKA